MIIVHMSFAFESNMKFADPGIFIISRLMIVECRCRTETSVRWVGWHKFPQECRWVKQKY